MVEERFVDSITTVEGHKYKGQLKDAVGKPWVMDGTGTMIYTNGDSYTGSWEDGKRHGDGVMTYKSGEVYEGEWKEDRQEGCGVLTSSNGDVYEGSFVGGKRKGMGTEIIKETGERYVGCFDNNLRNGRGILEKEGTKYDGLFEDGVVQGKGTITFANGDSYTGTFQDGKMHGWGLYSFANGDVFEGEFKNGRRIQGQLIQGDGVRYNAEFKPNGDLVKLRAVGEAPLEVHHCNESQEAPSGDAGSESWKEGKGTITYANGDKYSGDFFNNQRHGVGVMKYVNGDVYQGHWSEDQRCGPGRMTWQETRFGGWRYDGEWYKDLPDGHGTLLIDLDGSKYEGCWVAGKRCGLGAEVINGCTYEGDFKDDLRHGKGVLTTSDGNEFSGTFVDGKLTDSNAVIKYSNGDRYEGDVTANVRSGEGLMVYNNGDRYEGEFREDKRWGSGEITLANGDVYEGMWADDVMHGHGVMVYKGIGTYDGTFRSGKKHGKGVWIETSGERYAVEFKDNDLVSKEAQ